MKINMLYNKVGGDAFSVQRLSESNDKQIAWLRKRFQKIYQMSVVLREDDCKYGIFPMTIHVLKSRHEVLEDFEDIFVLDGAPFEHFNQPLKKSWKKFSKGRNQRMEETSEFIDLALKRPARKRGHKLLCAGGSKSKPSPNSKEFPGILVFFACSCTLQDHLVLQTLWDMFQLRWYIHHLTSWKISPESKMKQYRTRKSPWHS